MLVTRYLNILVNLIIDKYFKETLCIMHAVDNNTHNTKVVHLSSAPSIITADVDSLQLDTNQICRQFLLQSENATHALFQVERVIKLNSNGMYNNRKYLIIIDDQETFDVFYNSSSLIFVRDVLVIYILQNFSEVRTPQLFLRDNEFELKLYTHKYIGIEKNNDPVLLDVWFANNQSFMLGNDLFPDKVTNQQGRELRVSCMFRMPFSNCAFDSSYGNEHNLILKYVERFNLTLSLLAIADDSLPLGFIRENGTGSGILGGLISDEDDYNDMMYGGSLLKIHVDSIRSVRYTYEVSVPLPTLKYGWFMFIEVFKAYSWLLLLATYVSARLLVLLKKNLQKLITKSSENRSTLELGNIKMYGFLINQSVRITQDIKDSAFLKYIVILLLFSSVLIVTAYNSRLSSVMVAPVYENDINTLEECADSNLKLLFFDAYYRVLKRDTRAVFKELVKKIFLIPNNTDFELSEELLSSGLYAVARYKRSSGGYFEFKEHLSQMYKRYKPITPELFTDYYYIIMRKNSMHTVQLNTLMDSAIEVGLMQFWEEDALRYSENSTFMRLIDDHKFDNVNTHLNMKHLKGCLALWIIGMIFSFFIFLREVYNDPNAQKPAQQHDLQSNPLVQ